MLWCNYAKHKCVPWSWKHQNRCPCDQIAMIPNDHQNQCLTSTTHATTQLSHLQKCQHHCHALVVPMCCAYFQRSLASQVALKGQQLVCVSEDQTSEPDMRHACWKRMKSSSDGKTWNSTSSSPTAGTFCRLRCPRSKNTPAHGLRVSTAAPSNRPVSTVCADRTIRRRQKQKKLRLWFWQCAPGSRRPGICVRVCRTVRVDGRLGDAVWDCYSFVGARVEVADDDL